MIMMCMSMRQKWHWWDGGGSWFRSTGFEKKPGEGASFLTVSGDFIGGSSWGVFEGKPMIEIFNEMKCSLKGGRRYNWQS
eukprot:TRINITY_DN7290_c0_g1_i1.p2 TRINITY_DN7290_c0_g1~~TRINITY_DN7290_c0_g1_i1.p2  ORF type:complete len:80 (+),score=14.09 TRINITY_DN7290_c0_g1_i1:174-413(+)